MNLDLENLAPKLGEAQRRVILALSDDWGPSPDHQAAKRMWSGITGRGIKRMRGPVYVVEHKHQTDNCWRLNDNGLALQAALRALAAGSRRAKTPQAVECEASQSGGDSRNAQNTTSQSAREPGHLANNQPGTDK